MSKTFLKILIITAVMSLSVASSASAGWTEGKYNSAIEFNGSTTYVDGFGAIGNIKTVSFWIKADSLTEKVVDLNGTQTITINAGTISANGFTSPTIYVDGKVSSTLPDTNWHHIAITINTDVNASAVVIGKVSADYFTGALDNVRLYPYARSADEIRLDYNAGVATHLGPSGKTCSEDPASCMDYGLVGSWNMDEGTGTTAYDGSDEGNDGTLIHDPKWTTGKSGSALQFDGVDDYVDCGNDESLDITDAITIEAWVKYPIIPTDGLKHKALERRYDAFYFGFHGSPAKWVFRILINGTNTKLETTPQPVDTWHHYVLTYNGSYVQSYIDGQTSLGASRSGSLDAWYDRSENFRIGSQGGAYPFNGTIDDVRIYNRALSAEEVRYHYNHGGPVASWNFDEGSGTVAYDGTANNNDGTLGGGTAAYEPSWVEGKYGGALSFDGTDDYVDCGNDESLNITDVITVEAWVKISSIERGNHDNNFLVKYQQWGFGINSDLDFTAFTWGDNLDTQLDNKPIALNTWFHCAMIYDQINEYLAVYKNGELVAEDTSYTDKSVSTNNNVLINGNDANGVGGINGTIDEVRIYNYVRTPEQILQDYNAGKGVYFK